MIKMIIKIVLRLLEVFATHRELLHSWSLLQSAAVLHFREVAPPVPESPLSSVGRGVMQVPASQVSPSPHSVVLMH